LRTSCAECRFGRWSTAGTTSDGRADGSRLHCLGVVSFGASASVLGVPRGFPRQPMVCTRKCRVRRLVGVGTWERKRGGCARVATCRRMADSVSSGSVCGLVRRVLATLCFVTCREVQLFSDPNNIERSPKRRSKPANTDTLFSSTRRHGFGRARAGVICKSVNVEDWRGAAGALQPESLAAQPTACPRGGLAAVASWRAAAAARWVAGGALRRS
jgi:hypothetical protein